MPIILAIDTSLTACSAALLLNDKVIVEKFVVKPREHAALILPMINELLAETQTRLIEINAIAFGCGPASFTGIRIAASVTQGLAFAHNIPVIPISTLQALAQTAYREKNIKNAVVVLDAHMGEIYSAIYSLTSQNIMQLQGEEHLLSPQQLVLPDNIADNCYGIGDGWQAYHSVFAALGIPAENIIAEQLPHSKDIAWLAQNYYEQGKVVSALEALPIYLRDKSAWKTHSSGL